MVSAVRAATVLQHSETGTFINRHKTIMKKRITINGSNLQGFTFDSDWGGENNTDAPVTIYGTVNSMVMVGPISPIPTVRI